MRTSASIAKVRHQRRLGLSPCHQTWQDLSAAVDPSAELLCRCCPVPLIDPPPQRRCLQPPGAEVEGEVHDGREPPVGLGGQHRAVAQRGGQRGGQVVRQVALCVGLRDRWVLRISALKVWQDSCHDLYLPRLLNSDVFTQAVTAGCSMRDGLTHAAGKDGERWLGFAFGKPAIVTLDSDAVLIERDAAAAYQQKLEAEQSASQQPPAGGPSGAGNSSPPPGLTIGVPVPKGPGAPVGDSGAGLPRRFFGTVEVDATTATMDFSTIVTEVIQHFAARMGVEVKVTVEIEARAQQGFDAGFQRTVKENCGVLKFDAANFEQE